jgi:hypothetical protein
MRRFLDAGITRGAACSRDFTYALLAAVGGADDPGLQSTLDRLAGADLLISEGAGSLANYRFKHALIQDAAYQSLLKSRRQALPRRAATARRLPRKRSRPPSLSRNGRERAASSCGRPLRSPNSTNRPAAPVDALAVLAPALGGFEPTPEMPEIAAAQALTERLHGAASSGEGYFTLAIE